MIKVLLKHLIYEKCIDILFDSIFMNFVVPSGETREKWLENYLINLAKSNDSPFIYDGGTCRLNPYVKKAMTELKAIKIANGTFRPVTLPSFLSYPAGSFPTIKQ